MTHTPPAALAHSQPPPAKRSRFRSPGWVVTFCTIGAGLLLIPFAVFTAQHEPRSDQVAVEITSCGVDSIGVTHIRYLLTNNSDRTTSYTLRLRVFDYADRRIGDVTERVRDVAPGQTVHGERLGSFTSGAGSCAVAVE